MPIARVEYLRWAKGLPACRYRLSDSGVPDVAPEEFPLNSAAIRLDVCNPYGLPELIEALANRYGVSPERVLPLAGASGANFTALGAIVAPGDLVLLETPGYEPLQRAAEFLGAGIGWLSRDAGRGFQFDFDVVERALRERPRALAVTDLHNPSGLRLPAEDLEALVRLTGQFGTYLIVDEVYLEYAAVNRDQPVRPAALLGDHVISTNSLTKVYGLGRLRAGWLLAAPAVVDKARDVLDHIWGGNSVPSEQLAVQALARIDMLAERTRRLYDAGRPVFSRWQSSREDVLGQGNDGAVFAFPRIRGVPDTRPLCELLAREYDTLIVPGGFFGAPEHVRISFCRFPDLIAEGLSRVSEAIDRVRRHR